MQLLMRFEGDLDELRLPSTLRSFARDVSLFLRSNDLAAPS